MSIAKAVLLIESCHGDERQACNEGRSKLEGAVIGGTPTYAHTFEYVWTHVKERARDERFKSLRARCEYRDSVRAC